MRPHRHWNPLAHAIAHRLQWRIFFWFALAILLTGLTAGGIARTLAPSNWQKRMENVPKLWASQIAQQWEDIPARGELLGNLSQALDMALVLKDERGDVVERAGPDCQGSYMEIPVERAGMVLGKLELCHAHRGLWRWALPLIGVVFVLLLLSGGVARRLGWPLSELARVAQEIGRGNLKSRVAITRRMGIEARIVAESVNDMAARIEKQLSDQRELLAAVSHELRTPLQRIRLLAELGRDGGFTDQAINSLDREVVEIDALVGELLANARLDFGSVSLRLLDLRDSCVEALERAGLPLDLLSVEGNAIVQADPTLLSRALANLISNATRHGGGPASLRLSGTAEEVRISVEDGGPGFTGEDLEHLFEPFYRRPKRAESGGLGLGLSLVKRIAEAHGGKTFVENRPEGGARVGIVLPT